MPSLDYSSTNCHLEHDEDITAHNRQSPSTTSNSIDKPNLLHKATPSKHVCKVSRVQVQNFHKADSVSSLPEDHSRNNTLYSEKDPSPCHYHENVNCSASHKPPILPRKSKNNKPPVAPRTLGPFANYSTHDAVPSSKNVTTPTSATTVNQDIASPVHEGHQKQNKTHEMVMLKQHPRYVIKAQIIK